MKKFALIGAAGYIAPRHMKAILDTGNDLVAAFDPYDGVGILDSYFPNANFFTEFERFDRHLDLLRRSGTPVEYISICSPNYLHDSHIRFALKNNCHVICEKPLVISSHNLVGLKEIEYETKNKVNAILQLRLHPSIIALREKILNGDPNKIYNIDLSYITSRGNWYHYSWKGDLNKSGGIATNIGVHFFDMLTWIFGGVKENTRFTCGKLSASGKLILERANVNWKLSVDHNDIPETQQSQGKRTFRHLLVDGMEIEFSDGFTDLHTKSYQHILDGKGYGIDDCRLGLEIVEKFQIIDHVI
jgi:UDP-N-acetyl-2-amino-2-deoxyglucuronate dehydrogenase